MTVVCINAVSIREGGSLVVLRELLLRMIEKRPNWTWHIATNEQAYLSLTLVSGIHCHVYPNEVINSIRVRWWYEFELPNLIAKCKADVLFSQTNYLPSRILKCPTLLLVQNAGHFSEVFKYLTEQRLSSLGRLFWRMKSAWVRSSLRRANHVTVQTQALADRIQEVVNLPADRLSVIPHGTGLAVNHEKKIIPTAKARTSVRIGYITKFGVQKNFGVIFRAAKILKARNVDFRIVLTLDLNLIENREVFKDADQYGILDKIENHGEIGSVRINELYRTIDIFLFPSLCESFGFPLLEAMAYGLPIVAADTPSNSEVLGHAGVLFSPDDEHALVSHLENLIQDQAFNEEQSRFSLERASCFSWDKSASETLSVIDSLIASK